MQLILGALRVQLSGNRLTVCSTDIEGPAGLRVSKVPDICTESKVRCLCLWWDGKEQFCLAVSRAAPQTTMRPLPLLMEKEPAGTVAGDFHTRTMGRGTAGRHGALRKGESIRRMGV